MRTIQQKFAFLLVSVFLISLSGSASAIKYMSLKEALKHFMPAGAKIGKVTKSISDVKLTILKKKFDLKDSTDFKDKLKAGPYDVYIGRDAGGAAKVYVMVLDQYWRTCYHKYAVALDAHGKIKEMVVMEFNCKYQYPINKKSFLKQFNGKKEAGSVKVGKEIDVVSGATRSCEATAMVARKALALFEAFFAK